MGISFSLARPNAITSSIRIKVSVNGVSIFLYPGSNIPTVDWDKKKCFIRSSTGVNNARVIKYLKGLEIQILDLLDLYRNGSPKMTFLEFREKLNLLVDNPNTQFSKSYNRSAKTQELVIDFLQKRFIVDCQSGVRLSPKRQKLKSTSLHTYFTTLGHWKKFEEVQQRKIALKDFNQKDIDQFSDYLIIDCELAMNTHAKVLTDMLQVLKYAIHLKLLPPSRLVEFDFDTRREETDSIYLTETELLELMSVDQFNSDVEEQVRDVFVLGCFTGMRFSDYSTLDTKAIRNNRLEFVQKKTGNKVTIPIHPTVRQILEKYNYTLPEVPPNNEFNRITIGATRTYIMGFCIDT